MDSYNQRLFNAALSVNFTDTITALQGTRNFNAFGPVTIEALKAILERDVAIASAFYDKELDLDLQVQDLIAADMDAACSVPSVITFVGVDEKPTPPAASAPVFTNPLEEALRVSILNGDLHTAAFLKAITETQAIGTEMNALFKAADEDRPTEGLVYIQDFVASLPCDTDGIPMMTAVDAAEFFLGLNTGTKVGKPCKFSGAIKNNYKHFAPMGCAKMVSRKIDEATWNKMKVGLIRHGGYNPELPAFRYVVELDDGKTLLLPNDVSFVTLMEQLGGARRDFMDEDYLPYVEEMKLRLSEDGIWHYRVTPASKSHKMHGVKSVTRFNFTAAQLADSGYNQTIKDAFGLADKLDSVRMVEFEYYINIEGTIFEVL